MWGGGGGQPAIKKPHNPHLLSTKVLGKRLQEAVATRTVPAEAAALSTSTAVRVIPLQQLWRKYRQPLTGSGAALG